jgi:tRNA-uridine 2-sulfurtransferase
MVSCAMETVFVAMSGGFDSSFTAHILKKNGYKVVGITFRLLPETIINKQHSKVCCSMDAVANSRKAASHLSIPHYVIDLREDFERYVIERFIDEYKTGTTPNPCIFCNKFIKFSSFAKKAFSMGADKIATGHYAGIEEIDGNYFQKKGIDKAKDQSYFLYAIEKDILKRTFFPLGQYRKSNLKKEAQNMSWNIHSIRDSQDICFIPDNDYRQFLSSFIELKKGPVYHINGTFLGNHNGLHLYTIGQRRGINIPYREPLYVIKTIPDENALIVGSKEDLKQKTLIASEVSLFSHTSGNVSGKVRYRQKEESCIYEAVNNILQVEFLHPMSSVTPGQSVVLYDGDIVVGGGIIQKRIDR